MDHLRTPNAANLTSEDRIRLSISRPKRPVPRGRAGAAAAQALKAASHQKRYATLFLSPHKTNHSDNSDTSSETTYSTTSSVPRRRKLSKAEDVAARVRARWAAMETLASPGPIKSQEENKENFRPIQGFPTSMSSQEVLVEDEKPLPSRPSLSVKMDAVLPSTAHVTPISSTVTFMEEQILGMQTKRDSRTCTTNSPQILRRQSGVDELDEVREEAMVMMIHTGRVDGTIPCQRPGCGDVLMNVRALTFHLHIHDIHDRMAPRNFTCAECTGSYESTRELSMHDCERHRSCIGVSPPSGPIKDRFLRIVHGWNCLSDPVNA